jgi:hypothetical protein
VIVTRRKPKRNVIKDALEWEVNTWNLFVLEGNIKKISTQETSITHAKQNG